MAGGDLGGAVRDDGQQPRVRRRGEQVAEQRERGAVGGVEVLQHDDERALAGGGADQRGDRVEHAQALLLAVLRGAARRDLGRAAVAGDAADVVEHLGGEAARGGHKRA